MASGVPVHDECKQDFEQMKLKRAFKWVICEIVKKGAGHEIVVVNKGEPTASFDDFYKTVTTEYKDQPCYIMVDKEVEVEGGVSTGKLVFINWCPETCPVKKKMLQASSLQAFQKKVLDGSVSCCQATEASEITEDVLTAVVTK